MKLSQGRYRYRRVSLLLTPTIRCPLYTTVIKFSGSHTAFYRIGTLSLYALNRENQPPLNGSPESVAQT